MQFLLPWFCQLGLSLRWAVDSFLHFHTKYVFIYVVHFFRKMANTAAVQTNAEARDRSEVWIQSKTFWRFHTLLTRYMSNSNSNQSNLIKHFAQTLHDLFRWIDTDGFIWRQKNQHWYASLFPWMNAVSFVSLSNVTDITRIKSKWWYFTPL